MKVVLYTKPGVVSGPNRRTESLKMKTRLKYESELSFA